VDKKSLTFITIIFMVFIGLQFATPISAAKLVDSYSLSKYDEYLTLGIKLHGKPTNIDTQTAK